MREPWQSGDLLLVDNIRTAHSREPYDRSARGAGRAGRPGAPGRLRADRRGDCQMSAADSAAADRAAMASARPGRVTVPPFAVIPGAQVRQALRGREQQITELVEATYRRHGAGDSVNPPSCFLRFPDRPSDRIIALPASIGGPHRVDGLKWISSFPGNVAAGLPRASAVLILNDPGTGYPFACLESSIISATRTAASAAVAAHWLCASRDGRGRPRPARAGFVGTGLIARYIHTFLAGTGWTFDQIGVHDLSAASAAGFRGYLEQSGATGQITVHQNAEQLIRASDLVVFATIASRAARQRPVLVRAQSAGAAHIAARPHPADPARLHQHRRRRGPLPESQHLTAPGRTAHRQPGLPGRHARRRDGRAGHRTHGPARHLLPVRPRRPRPGRRQIRLRPDSPLRRTCTSSTTSSTS